MFVKRYQVPLGQHPFLGGDLWQGGVDRFVNYNLLSLHFHGYIWDLIWEAGKPETGGGWGTEAEVHMSSDFTVSSEKEEGT